MVTQAHSLYVDVDAIRVDALDIGGASEASGTKHLLLLRKIYHMSLKQQWFKSSFTVCPLQKSATPTTDRRATVCDRKIFGQIHVP